MFGFKQAKAYLAQACCFLFVLPFRKYVTAGDKRWFGHIRKQCTCAFEFSEFLTYLPWTFLQINGQDLMRLSKIDVLFKSPRPFRLHSSKHFHSWLFWIVFYFQVTFRNQRKVFSSFWFRVVIVKKFCCKCFSTVWTQNWMLCKAVITSAFCVLNT